MTPSLIMVHLFQPLNDAGDPSPTERMYRSTSRSPEFAHVALMPFGYPRRVFNIFPLRDLPDLTVIDGVGERNGVL